MPYIPYTRDTPLSLNALTVTEGFDSKSTILQVDNVKNIITSFQNGRNQAIINSYDISRELDNNERLQQNVKYNKYIPINGKVRPSAADEMIHNSALLNDANNQVYILGSIAVASLVILSLYM